MTGSNASIALNPRIFGILCVMGSATLFSIQDMLIKLLSGDYALHQITFIRGITATLITLAIFVPLEGGYANLRTTRWRVHLFRGFLVVAANMSFFSALATMPLGEATAIYFFAPLVITALSAIVLGEHVGPRRIAAVIIGFIGVLLVVRPGQESFSFTSLLPLLAAIFYGALQVSTRYLGLSEKASTMSFYMQLTFVLFSGTIGLAFGDGSMSGSGKESLEFLTRAWIWPPLQDWGVIMGTGCLVSFGGYLVSQAYRNAEGGLIAPFEYIALPISIFFGIAIWGDWPDAISWIGITIIAAAGIYVFVREALTGRRSRHKVPVRPAK